MKWLSALFGHARVPKSRLEQIFALSTARVTLDVTFGLRPSGRAGLAFRAVDSSYFRRAEEELSDLLELALRDAGTRHSRSRDQFGYDWLVLEDEQLDDLVAASHLVGRTLQDHGFADRLLAAVFPFDGESGHLFWLYNYKRAAFYPFVPEGSDRRRNHQLEMRLAAVMRSELPIESDQQRWYPLWGTPV